SPTNAPPSSRPRSSAASASAISARHSSTPYAPSTTPPDMVTAIRAEMARSETTSKAYRELARLIPEREAVEGVRWLRAAMGRSDSVEIDGRLIPISARSGEPVARLIHAACTEAGISRYLLSPHVQVQDIRRAPTPEEAADLERRRKEAQKRAWRRIADRAAGQDGGSDAA